ncbi:MAG: CPBP family glutamic-type intramembrane protease [Candidatus Hodarchaeales archaeon]|jgi:membrane protease YdiL (CAAX protease family)/RNA polymerase subunit RPABC4/transcription elongation factor Spt4
MNEEESNEHTDRIQCLTCMQYNPRKNKFCSYCGQLFNKLILCPQCHELIPEQVKFCPKCGFHRDNKITCPNCNSITPQGKFCGICGAPLKQELPIHPPTINQPQPHFPEYNTPIHSQYQYPPYPRYYPRVIKYEEPAWWKMPVFFIILGVFGLTIFTQFIVLFLAVFFLEDLEAPLTLLILEMSVRLLGLFLIAFAVNHFLGFRNFWDSSTSDDISVNESQKSINNGINSNDGKITDVANNQHPKFSIIQIFSIFIILTAGFYLYEQIAFYIMLILKDIFSISQPIASPYTQFDESGDVYIAFLFMITFFAPFHEEMLYRGYLQQALERSETADWTHYLIQGIAFSFAHLPGDILGEASIDFIILHMINAGLFGIAATWLKKKYKSVIYPMILHGLTNGTSAMLSLIVRILPDNTNFDILEIVLFLVAIFLILVFSMLLKIVYNWRITRPLALKNKNVKSSSSWNFISRILLLMVIFSSLQYGLLFLDETIQMDIGLVYFLGLTIATGLLFYIWGKKVVDVKWLDFYPEKEGKSNQTTISQNQ